MHDRNFANRVSLNIESIDLKKCRFFDMKTRIFLIADKKVANKPPFVKYFERIILIFG